MAGGDDMPAGMSRYTKGAILGEGTFGVVFKATDTVVRCSLPFHSSPACRPLLTRGVRVQTNQVVAMKKIRLGKYKEVRPRRQAVGRAFARLQHKPQLVAAPCLLLPPRSSSPPPC